MTLKILKMMQIYQNTFFRGFHCYFAIFDFFWNFIKNMGQKLGSNRCLLFTMLTKQKFLNILHSKLVKKTKGLLAYWVIHSAKDFAFQRKVDSLSWVTYPFWRKVVYFQGRPAHTLTLVYFQGRPAHTYSRWSIFKGDLPTHTHAGLFSGATSPHILRLVYFHGRPTHTYSSWSIFTGDLPTHTHAGLFSRATCPHMLTLVYFHGRPAHTRSQWFIFKGDQPTHTQTGLFSRATCPHTHTGLFSQATYLHMLIVVYFQGWPTHTYSRWSIFTGDLPFWLS